MIRAFDAFSLPLLRWLDPEDAHRMAIQGLRLLPPMRPRVRLNRWPRYVNKKATASPVLGSTNRG